jgi:hypothetical protein
MASRIAGMVPATKRYIDSTVTAILGLAVRFDITQVFSPSQRVNLISTLGQISPFQSVAYAASLSLPLAASVNNIVVLYGNPVMVAPTGGQPGVTYLVYLKQDGAGSRTVAWTGANFDFGGAGAPILTTTPNKTDIVAMVCDASPTSFRCFLVGKNFNF